MKSVITTDLEGRIETFNRGAEELFGYTSAEVIGKKRVSLFSPGLVVLSHVPTWLKTASTEGEYSSQTVFIRKDGSQFAADIRIKPTFRDGKQIGYCGVTVERTDLAVEQAMPKISMLTKIFAWMVITRAPFLTATIVPILAAGAWVVASGKPANWIFFALAFVGGISMHIAANTFNDYFDWRSGTDPENNDYFLPYSGGSRSLELGLINEKQLFRVASGALVFAVLAGMPVIFSRGPLLILIGVFGAFSAYFYTAPPLRLVARKGLGELLIGLNFGPLMVAGTVFAITGSASWLDYFVGLPIGLFTTAILWINQFPDMASDRLTGKYNLVVVLGKERARWGYVAIMAAAFGSVVWAVLAELLPLSATSMLLGTPLAVYASVVLFRHYDQRSLVKANSTTIMIQLVAGLLLAGGLLIG